MSKQRMSAVDFVRLCNESNSVAEVAQKMGCTVNNVHQRRSTLAKQGVKFKAYADHRGGPHRDVAALIALGEETLPEGAETFVPKTRQTAEVTA